MGWKLAVAISRLEGRSLQAFVDDIYGTPQSLKQCNIATEDAFYRRSAPRELALAYEGHGWIFDWKLVERSLSKPIAVEYLLSTFALLSTVNHYGFASQSEGVVLRCRVGDADGGIRVDAGTPSVAERTLVSACAKPGQEAEAWSIWCDASRSFDGKYPDTTHDGMGEDVVLGLIEALVGFHPGDDTPVAKAFCEARTMEIVRPPGFFARLIGAR